MRMPFRSRRWRRQMRRRVGRVGLWIAVVVLLNILGCVVASKLGGL